jgi:uncharacterized membrane protein (UPF0127 family)
MAKTHTTPANMTVKIVVNDKGNPPGKLAEAELHFGDGPLAGLKLSGVAIGERRRGAGRNVTFPARLYSGHGERRSFALSNRPGLSGADGLLLKWDMPGRHPIWMAEMQFALDLAWLDPDGRVVAVLANVPPCRANPCGLYEPDGADRSVAVLEMPAGAAANHLIAVGAIVRSSTDSPQAR